MAHVKICCIFSLLYALAATSIGASRTKTICKASFATCSNTTQFSCSHPHHLNVTAGKNIEFDTRIKYDGSRSSHIKQTIILLQMFKGPISEKNLQYECGNTSTYRGKLCQPKGRIGVVQVTGQKFDMKLSLHNATLNDAGVYTVRVKVVSPDRSKEFSLTKTFQVHMIGVEAVSHTQGTLATSISPSKHTTPTTGTTSFTLTSSKTTTPTEGTSNDRGTSLTLTSSKTTTPREGTSLTLTSSKTTTPREGTTSLTLTSSKTTTPREAPIIVAVSAISVVIVFVVNVITIVVMVCLTLHKHHVQSDMNAHQVLQCCSSITIEQQIQPAEKEHIYIELEQPDQKSLHCEGNNDSKLDERFKGQYYNI